ncbi:golgin subfamily A member 6-like protein 1 [Telopea speciosissima]|uniref:golgin subfamily A member 6-like protein 1 n=1 Tax=Telopea speciosissima TaxID=54955 RepID=UPI001CC5DB85|nr:golgin subfamily A member 6-like protein 1 [Telopea speciosissima]XP_043707495.1 golgin subfamily A member 6-like protein 1 [Telopea speciosissima]
MAATRPIFRSASSSPSVKFVLAQTLRFKSTSTTPSHHNQHQLQHEFSTPNEFLGSWKPPKDPKEAEANLAQLRREYAKQVKELRKEYIYEMELHRQEKQLKDEAKREAIRLAREERKAAKAAMAQARAAERKAIEEEFRQTLLKERAEKLEYWRSREKRVKDRKNEKKELLHRQSSMWVDEQELEKKILEAIIDMTPL